MSGVVRLEGDDPEVVAVADAALASIPPEHAEWVAGVRALHMQRLQQMAQLGRSAGSPAVPPASAAEPSRSIPTVLWWVVLSFGVAAAFSGGALLLPQRYVLDPALTVAVATPAMCIGGALLLVAAVTMPRAAKGSTATALAVIAATMALASSVAAVLRFETMVTAGGAAATLAWAIGAGVALLAGVVLALRAAPTRRSAADRTAADRRRAWQHDATAARRSAEQLLRKAPQGGTAPERWSLELDRLQPRVTADALAQARELGPWGWLVWSAYDGDIKLPRLLAR